MKSNFKPTKAPDRKKIGTTDPTWIGSKFQLHPAEAMRFHKICKENHLKVNQLVKQMVRHCLGEDSE